MMRSFPLVATLCLALVTTGLPSTAIGQSTTVTVHLTVHTDIGDDQGWDPDADSHFPGTAACDVEVPAGADGATVLDQATLDGCILGWTASPLFPCFVETIDGVHAALATWFVMDEGQWWQFHLNGQMAAHGICDYSAENEDDMRWFYESGEL